MPETYDYVGLQYTQGKSTSQLLTFNATANDIREWGGIPTKTERFHGGFQRALSDRYKGVVKFFDDGQTSPTSIVVAFRHGALNVTELGYPASWVAAKELNEKPQFVHISFEAQSYDADTTDLDTLRGAVREMLAPRLEASQDFEASNASTEAALQNAEAEAEEEKSTIVQEGLEAHPVEASAGGDDDEDDLEIDIGESKLRDFYNFLGDPQRIEDWLTSRNEEHARLKSEKSKSRADRELVAITPEQRLKQSLVSLLRPAMIVDGQHRVSGAYASSSGPIMFTVCAIKDANWIEQVFQFVVLNKLARPISGSFLTSLLNTSLTNEELKTIEPQLEMVDIKNTDRQLMKYLNYVEESPFFGMISQPGEMAGVDNQGRLSDKGMLRVAKRWYGLSATAQEIKMFLPALEEKSLTKARKQWKRHDVWTAYFYAFWGTLKDKYEREGIWEKREKYHLLYIVTLITLQNVFLKTKAAADTRFKDVEDFTDQVKTFFEDVKATFFQNWQATGLQSGEGFENIADAVMALRSGKRLATVQEESPLFNPTTKRK